MSKPKHILVIRLSAMGDVAMTTPIIRALSNQYPDLKITVLTKEYFSPFFRELKNVNVFYADINQKHKGLGGLYKLSNELKQLKFDAVADLHNVLRSNIIKRLLLVKPFAQIDKGRVEKKALVSKENFQQLKTTHQRYADVFEQLGFKIELSKPSFPEPVLLKENLQKLFKKENKAIGIAPFAAYKSKMYPLELMQVVINELVKEYQILLFGGGEKEIIQLENINGLIFQH